MCLRRCPMDWAFFRDQPAEGSGDSLRAPEALDLGGRPGRFFADEEDRFLGTERLLVRWLCSISSSDLGFFQFSSGQLKMR